MFLVAGLPSGKAYLYTESYYSGHICNMENYPTIIQASFRLGRRKIGASEISHSFHEAKNEYGMANYQVSQWGARLHRIALVVWLHYS
jgi:hypothetical protein